jgi:carbamoylphosphate synthase large subunit
MRTVDRWRFAAARWRRRPTVLFSRWSGWQRPLARHTHRHTAFFYDLHEVDPGGFDLVVPLGLEARRHLCDSHRELLGRSVLVPDDDTVRICDDKLHFAKHLLASGLGHVVPPLGPDLQYPYVLKARVGEFGVGTTIVENEEQATAMAVDLASESHFVQASVPGTEEFTTHFVADRGQLRLARTLQFSFDTTLFVKGRGQPARRRVEVDHSRFDSLLARIVASVGYSGIGCLNYKLVDGVPRVFELNPRVGGSMYLFADEMLATCMRILQARPAGT